VRHQVLSLLKSGRFWSGVAALIAGLVGLQALGVFDLLFSASPVATFHQTADRACARLPEATIPPEGVEIAGAQVGDFTPPLSAHGLITTEEMFSRRIVGPVNEITRALFAAPPPPAQYSDEYKSFERQWVSMAHGLSSLELQVEEELYELYFLRGEWPERTLPRSRLYSYLKRLMRVLDHDKRIMREAKQASELASILDVERCVMAVTWIQNEAENLGTLLLGYPATTIGKFGTKPRR
jgi:hypothetical protein